MTVLIELFSPIFSLGKDGFFIYAEKNYPLVKMHKNTPWK